ncbi:MAG TPA: hypothetical protein VHE12_04080 [bacterium]|nr:hypothetical protein [bacterium]
MGLIRVHPRQFAAKGLIFLFFLLMGITRPSLAADRPKEDDLFGGEQAKPAATTPADESGAPAMRKKDIPEESLQIGGTLSSEADYYLVNGVPLENDQVANPNLLFLYLDSKLENDSRVFARTRLYYDPTGLTGGGGSASFSNPYGFGLGTSENLQVSLQELRISANIGHQLFFTLGRQKVKYGAAKFFNPTDFLNSQQFDFFLPSDERPGVDMVKMQVPSGTANLYLCGLVGNPSTGNPSGGYFRGELGYDGLEGLLGAGEISLSGILPRGQTGKAGFDISQSVGDLDFYFEGAMGQNDAGEWKDATSVGASWEIKYADRSSNTVTLQAEHFQAGALAEYGIFSIYLPGPGGWTDLTFIETNLYNLIDTSGLSRLDTVCQFSDRLSGRVYATAHWGSLGGTFYLPGQMAELGTRLDVNF